MDQLFSTAPKYGAPLLAARVPRAVVDLNRAADELDPALIRGVARRALTPRTAAGLGVIPRVVSEGRQIRDSKIPLSEAQRRLDRFWHPYHRRLRDLVTQQTARFGQAILFDCHSMPHEALDTATRASGLRPDVVLGNRHGTSCGRSITDGVAAAFAREGFTIALNAPFAGGFITHSYGRPSRFIHAIQIEIDRSLYMDERRICRNDRFDDTARRLERVTARLATLGRPSAQLAAE